MAVSWAVILEQPGTEDEVPGGGGAAGRGGMRMSPTYERGREGKANASNGHTRAQHMVTREWTPTLESGACVRASTSGEGKGWAWSANLEHGAVRFPEHEILAEAEVHVEEASQRVPNGRGLLNRGAARGERVEAISRERPSRGYATRSHSYVVSNMINSMKCLVSMPGDSPPLVNLHAHLPASKLLPGPKGT